MFNVVLVAILNKVEHDNVMFYFYKKFLAKSINNVYTYFRGDDNVEIRLQKWGNSDGIRIPSAFLKTLNLKTNDKVELIQEDDRIIISKCKKNKISLKERFAEYNGENLAKEFECDEARGREIW